MVQGVAQDVTSGGDDFSRAARGASVHPLASGAKTHRIAIDPISITGRRFELKG